MKQMTFAALILTGFLILAVGQPRSEKGIQDTNQPTLTARGGGGKCPKIYAPVTCDNGKTYPNQCEADRHNARNCVPSGDL